jgi:alkyl sulfatase BDS1-like metallo-beta-lactamase superfamily hydrolase
VLEVAQDLYYAHRPAKPIATIIYTHTHADHFGGVLAFTTRAQVASGEATIIARGHGCTDEHALSENVMVGNVMSRRVHYLFGALLPPESLRLANLGHRPIDIAERLELPDTLATSLGERGHHSTINHNIKAVFAKEPGWHNGNPAALNPHAESVSAPRYVYYRWAAPMPSSRSHKVRSTRATTDGRCNCWTTSSPPTPITFRPRNSQPTPASNSVPSRTAHVVDDPSTVWSAL